MNMLSRIPYASLLLTAAALVIYALPGAATMLQYDRTAIAAGELWRILSGHWTHHSASHLFWNVLAFLILAAQCERLNRFSFYTCLTSSAILIPLALLVTAPQLQINRGLSGIDSALFALLLATLLREEIPRQRLLPLATLCTFLLLFVTKTGYEAVTAQGVFVDSLGDNFVPVPLAHVMGVIIGILISLTPYPNLSTASPEASL
jgi:rhomboid family GlyGly-CTERM serine protease